MLKNSKVVLFLSPYKVGQAGNFWTLLRISPYMFRYRNAIFRESKNTKDHKSNTTLQVLTAVTVIFNILTW